MSERRDDEYRTKLRELFKDALPDDVVNPLKKNLDDVVNDFSERLEWWVKDDLADNLMYYVQEMSDRAIDAMLNGDEDQVRRYLSCEQAGYTGRDRDHQVIHGKLFETGGIALRRKLCETYSDLLKTERALDLESQVESLVAKVNDLRSRNEQLIERLNETMR